MTELQRLAADTTVIDRGDPERAAAMVTAALKESRSWLAVAMQGTDPTPIAEFKAWAVVVEEATRQKKLGREIEMDAAEMVRRAERGLGVAVRKGQDAGLIAKSGDVGGMPQPGATRGAVSGSLRGNHLDLPRNHFDSGKERRDAYAMTDGVTEEQFDEVIAEARAEGNMSRANVARKARTRPHGGEDALPRTTRGYQPRKKRAESIKDLAVQGYSTRQISKQISLSENRVRDIARDYGIEISADKVIARTRRHDSNRIAQETVQALAGLAMGVELIQYDEIDPTEVGHWTASLKDSLGALNHFSKQIGKAAQ